MTLTTRDAQTWEQMWLPLWPLASDDLRAGIYRTARKDARGRRYIEANPRSLSNLLVVDVDHEDALMRALWDRQDWLPNAVVENPENGHAHAVWALQEPVTRTEYAQRKPLAFAAAVTEGLRRSVDGDAAYSGLITKNPEHGSWHTSWTSDRLYSLGELASRLEEAGHMPAPAWRRSRRRAPVGLGRNCSIFETARVWAYREVRHHWGDPERLRLAIVERVHELNAGFSEPLPHREALDIAHSIHRWITTCSRMWADGPAVYEATFSTIQAARGRKGGTKSGETRTQERQERARLILEENA
ncbi:MULTISPECIES: replication initiation protein [Bacteria]|jgi:hypothetical protein|nr:MULTISPECIES: replication initiation protein [Bacteria]EIH5688811.1 replication initiation protein [Escherichia coli]KIK83707.1 hypothetical protein OC70_09075 [Micrococcus luteus]MCV7668330.1 replication initiation protein [Micrococcus luteus]MCV7728769.1 replication initiation protein [Micrococcus luteus]MDK7330390.1 replication initiation protein [Micrococcus luteus]